YLNILTLFLRVNFFQYKTGWGTFLARGRQNGEAAHNISVMGAFLVHIFILNRKKEKVTLQ
ncbi:MAG: hypothetical protein MJZ51_04840, partial [Bacteroidales bacterium]|nr:hypothetical protein [Bacteroidales bacterium]